MKRLVAGILLLTGCRLFGPPDPQQVWLQVCVVAWDTGAVTCSQRQCDVYSDGRTDCLNKPERPCTPRRCPVRI